MIHPDVLLPQLTADQWLEWEAYDSLEPIGFPVEDYRTGALAAAFFRAMGSETAEPHHFMIGVNPDVAVVDDKAVAKRLAMALGAKPAERSGAPVGAQPEAAGGGVPIVGQ